jgi:hypothetical protein
MNWRGSCAVRSEQTLLRTAIWSQIRKCRKLRKENVFGVGKARFKITDARWAFAAVLSMKHEIFTKCTCLHHWAFPESVRDARAPETVLNRNSADLWHYKSGNTFINTIDRRGNRLHRRENVGKRAVSQLSSLPHTYIGWIASCPCGRVTQTGGNVFSNATSRYYCSHFIRSLTGWRTDGPACSPKLQKPVSRKHRELLRQSPSLFPSVLDPFHSWGYVTSNMRNFFMKMCKAWFRYCPGNRLKGT